MVSQDSLRVALVQLIDRLPIPMLPEAHQAAYATRTCWA
jgi:hypothetical protein